MTVSAFNNVNYLYICVSVYINVIVHVCELNTYVIGTNIFK